MTTYTDNDGNTVTDTVRTYVRTERFGKKDVAITTKVSVHETPKGKRTVQSEESDYHYQEEVTDIEYLEGGGYTGKKSSMKKGKKKVCQMPPGFSEKYLSTSQTIGRFVDGKFIPEN
ncbi:MAG: hypothetical protein NC200_00005 [Candidatus Gastranaerophilales bacterium]|nr:hypothetical protein [Candidatus Gastranaerophilales bacterium]